MVRILQIIMKHVVPVTKSIRHILHGYFHSGAVPETGDVWPDPAPGRLPAFSVQRTRHACRLRLSYLYEL